MMSSLEVLAQQLIRNDQNAPLHHVMLQVEDHRNGQCQTLALGNNGPGGRPVQYSDMFRIGSITKTFTAALVLQLCEESLLHLDDAVVEVLPPEIASQLQHLNAQNLRLIHLLQHRSGLPDYLAADAGLVAQAFTQPGKQWHPWELANDFLKNLQCLSHEPGTGFLYADTNYLLLGIIAEHQTQETLAALMDVRIIQALGCSHTRLEDAISEAGMLVHYYGAYSMEAVNCSFDWGGGGLISNMSDLSLFVHALHEGRLFKNPETQKTMTSFLPATAHFLPYGFGLQQFEYRGILLNGHLSAYGAAMFYHRPTSTSIIIQQDQAAAVHKTQWLLRKLIQELLPQAAL